jgi:hypothetical protein
VRNGLSAAASQMLADIGRSYGVSHSMNSRLWTTEMRRKRAHPSSPIGPTVCGQGQWLSIKYR